MRVFLKKWIMLTVISALFVLTGCSGPSKEDVIKQLEPRGDERYAIHLFYRDNLPDSETTELNVFHNSDPDITEAITKVQFWDQEQDRNAEWAKALGIREFPAYLVIDAEGIALETPFLSRVKQFVSEALLTEGD